MNHAKITLAIVAAAALTAVVFAVPNTIMAYKHNHHMNNNNGIKVEQQVNQANIFLNKTRIKRHW